MSATPEEKCVKLLEKLLEHKTEYERATEAVGAEIDALGRVAFVECCVSCEAHIFTTTAVVAYYFGIDRAQEFADAVSLKLAEGRGESDVRIQVKVSKATYTFLELGVGAALGIGRSVDDAVKMCRALAAGLEGK